MAMQDKFGSYPDILTHPFNAISAIMDAPGERQGVVFQITQAGDIATVYLYSRTAGTADTVKVSLQSVSTSSGLPTGTILGATNSAYGTALINAGMTWFTVTLGEVATVTAGQWVAIVIEWNSYNSGNISFYNTFGINNSALSGYYSVSDVTATPGTWVKGNATIAYCLSLCYAYSGGVFKINGNAPFGGCHGTATSISSATTPDEAGNYFQVPVKMRAYGAWLYGDLDGDGTISLLDASNNVLSSVSIDPDYRGATSYVLNKYILSTPVTLSTGTWYRLIYSGGTVASTLYYIYAPSAAGMGIYDGGTLCYATSRVDGGAWTNVNTTRQQIGLLIDQFDDGVSGGGPLIDGRLVR